jgi:hypothetical protein
MFAEGKVTVIFTIYGMQVYLKQDFFIGAHYDPDRYLVVAKVRE